MRSVSLMGSTGSVGTQALDILRREPERFTLYALAAHRSVELLLAQAREFRPPVVVIGELKLTFNLDLGANVCDEVCLL